MLQRRQGRGFATRWTVAALGLYAVVFAVTVGVNIPLNNDIDRVGNVDRIVGLADVRNDFEVSWVAANIVRTVFSIAAVAALAYALFLCGRATSNTRN